MAWYVVVLIPVSVSTPTRHLVLELEPERFTQTFRLFIFPLQTSLIVSTLAMPGVGIGKVTVASPSSFSDASWYLSSSPVLSQELPEPVLILLRLLSTPLQKSLLENYS